MAPAFGQTPPTLWCPLLALMHLSPVAHSGRARHLPSNRCRLQVGMGQFQSGQGHEKGGAGEGRSSCLAALGPHPRLST